MNSFRFLLTAGMVIISSTLFAQQTTQQTDTIKVYGECGMCKSRIQKALKVEGVSQANWNPESKQLMVTYNPAVITHDEIQKKVTAVGHDTEKYRAEDAVYEKLPGCCHYERKKAQAHQDHSQHQQQ